MLSHAMLALTGLLHLLPPGDGGSSSVLCGAAALVLASVDHCH